MKTHHTLGIAILIILILATTLVVSAFHQPLQSTSGKTTVVLQTTVVPTATPETGSSQVGSTTGIFVMEFVILLIIAIPLIFRKKRKQP